MKQIAANNLFMRAVIIFAEVNHLTDIKSISKHIANGVDMNDAAAFPPNAAICKHTRNISKRNSTRGKSFKRFLHERRSLRINENGMCFEVIQIPKWCIMRPHSVSQFLPDAALHIFRKVIDVILRLAERDRQHKFPLWCVIKPKRRKLEPCELTCVDKVDNPTAVYRIACKPIRMPCDNTRGQSPFNFTYKIGK
ncbi:hypothetical protein M1555_01680 [Patescibacteria group bacterium]|nr:hypothetical protein [Patescibacteria group bacterium]